VPWHPAHAFESIAASGGAALTVAAMARPPQASTKLLHFVVMELLLSEKL